LSGMTARWLLMISAILLGAVPACGGGRAGTGVDAATPATTNYYSCDETYAVAGQTVHRCLEYSQESPFGTPSASQCPPAANGFTGTPGNGLSTTNHCPRTQPGCVCVYDEDPGRHYEEYEYQTASADAYQSAVADCKAVVAEGTVSCFGGLTAPADAGPL